MTRGKQIMLTAVALVAAVVFFGLSDADVLVQEFLYNADTQQWLLERNLQPYRFIFYDGIKGVLILFAVLVLGTVVFGRKRPWVQKRKRGLWIIVLSALIVPATVSLLKKETNMPCPRHTVHFGGVYPSVSVWEHYPKSFKQPSPIRCWPAGHASGGFALLSLFFLFRSRKNRTKAVLFALGTGWIMGGYKMLIGDHYLSHTVITMLLSWLLILLIATAVERIIPSPADM